MYLETQDVIVKHLTCGAELEYVPLSSFPMFRLDKEIIKNINSVYSLSRLKGRINNRQPSLMQLVDMLYTVGLINHYAEKYHPGKQQFRAKLCRKDCEKIKDRLIKLAQKQIDSSASKMSVSDETKKTGFSFSLLLQRIKDIFQKTGNNKHGEEKLASIDGEKMEATVIAIFERLENLGLIHSWEDNTITVGTDNSVYGTNKSNIEKYLELFKQKKDERYRFKAYNGQEINFPVCSTIEEQIEIYQFVLRCLKSQGVLFSSTSGVHLHVGVDKECSSVNELIDHLANVTAATAAASHALMEIVPYSRKNNIYCIPYGENVEHISHYQRPLSKLEYVQKKIDIVKRGIQGDLDLQYDKEAAMYEFALGVTYGIAPLQHEYNYRKLLEIPRKELLSIDELSTLVATIVRNPRYYAISATPLLKTPFLPTYEWRILPSGEDGELQGKLLTILYRIIETQTSCTKTTLCTNHDTGKDYIIFETSDSVKIMDNTLENWLNFTGCGNILSHDDWAKINNEDYWRCYDAKNQQCLDSQENALWAEGQFYPAPQIDIPFHLNIEQILQLDTNTKEYLEVDEALVKFMNYALNIGEN